MEPAGSAIRMATSSGTNFLARRLRTRFLGFGATTGAGSASSGLGATSAATGGSAFSVLEGGASPSSGSGSSPQPPPSGVQQHVAGTEVDILCVFDQCFPVIVGQTGEILEVRVRSPVVREMPVDRARQVVVKS